MNSDHLGAGPLGELRGDVADAVARSANQHPHPAADPALVDDCCATSRAGR
jgi:hypothetical protein